MLLLTISGALAQDTDEVGFDAHGFTLHAFDGDVRDALTVDRPGPWSGGDFWLAGVMEYADRPLVRVIESSAGTQAPVEEVALDQLVALNANVGVALHERVRLDATAPVYFYSLALDGPQVLSVGDVRASTMVAIVRPEHVEGGGGLGVGVSGHVDIPTGNAADLLGQPGVAGGFAVSGTYEGSWYTATAELGGQINPDTALDNLVNADQFVAGAAFNVLPGPRTGITAEAHLYTPFEPNAVLGSDVPAEVLLSLRHQLGEGVTFTMGGAAAISEGASAARYRAFLGIGYGMVKPPRKPDADALVVTDVRDRCPNAPETTNGWRDDDGCPDELGGLGVRVVYLGEDVDDADLVVAGPDGDTRVRSSERPTFKAVPGAAFSARAEVPARCLVGAATGSAGEATSELVVELSPRLDGVGDVEVVGPDDAPVTDATVRWVGSPATCVASSAPVRGDAPNVWRSPVGAGRHQVVVEAPGFKVATVEVDVPPGGARVKVKLESSRVVLERTRIAILDKVFFEFNKAVILPESFGLLDDVAGVIAAHPEVGRVQVEGHTDNKGNDAYNLKLSQSRADAVRTYMIARGIPPERLVAVGFGESNPIDTNQTDDGRSTNRRVEFNLVDQVTDDPTIVPIVAPGGAP